MNKQQSYLYCGNLEEECGGLYEYTETDIEVRTFIEDQLQSIIDHKYGLGKVWSKHYAETIVDGASLALVELSQEITEQRRRDEKDDYSY